MFTIDGKDYELRYSLKRVEMIEKATGGSMMASLVNNKGMLSIGEVKTFLSYGLKGMDEGDGHVSIPQGEKYAEQLLETLGYAPVIAPIMEALERDCPFLFQGA